MEKELDVEHLAELLKDPKNDIFVNLADHVLENIRSECCERLLMNIEKCRVYVDCIKGLLLFPRVNKQDEDIACFEEYQVVF